MDLERLLEEARQKEMDIHLEFDRRTAEYKAKKLQNDEIRRQLQKEEDDLESLIPEEYFIDGSEWSEVLEEIRALERLIGRRVTDG